MTTPNKGRVRELVQSERGPADAPYSTATVLGDLVWTSGALPVDPDGAVPGEFSDQVRLALDNLEESLRLAGADWSGVLKVNGYVTDIERLPELNAVYMEKVAPHGLPARTVVQVPAFRKGVQVEFDAIAHLTSGDEGEQ